MAESLRDQRIRACDNFLKELYGDMDVFYNKIELEDGSFDDEGEYFYGGGSTEGWTYFDETIVNPNTGEEIDVFFNAEFTVHIVGNYVSNGGDGYYTPRYNYFDEKERYCIITKLEYGEDDDLYDNVFDLDKLADLITDGKEVSGADVILQQDVKENCIRISEKKFRKIIKSLVREALRNI